MSQYLKRIRSLVGEELLLLHSVTVLVFSERHVALTVPE